MRAQMDPARQDGVAARKHGAARVRKAMSETRKGRISGVFPGCGLTQRASLWRAKCAIGAQRLLPPERIRLRGRLDGRSRPNGTAGSGIDESAGVSGIWQDGTRREKKGREARRGASVRRQPIPPRYDGSTTKRQGLKRAISRPARRDRPLPTGCGFRRAWPSVPRAACRDRPPRQPSARRRCRRGPGASCRSDPCPT